MFTKIKALLAKIDPTIPGPPLEEGEKIIRAGVGAKTKGMFGARWGPLVLTNRRLLWYENHSAWPLKTLSGEVRLAQVKSVDKGNFLNFIFGGMCIRMKLVNGRCERLYEGDGQLDDWIHQISRAAEVAEF